jgi:polyisoprenoid-binding protein YceI
METVEGKTNNISGTATLDVDNLTSAASGKIEVDLTTIDTGIGLRNQHMRENHLETDTYPTATFTLKGLSSPSSGTLAENSTVNALAEGTFDIHGISKDYSIPVTLTRTGNNIQVEGGWSLLLADHQIKRPEFLVMRLSEEQKITVKFEMSGN